MPKLHCSHPTITNRTRCGITKDTVFMTSKKKIVTCKRCLKSIEREKEKEAIREGLRQVRNGETVSLRSLMD